MPKEFKYIFNNWEDELLNISHEAIECAIASAYMSIEGVDFLKKVAKRLVELSTNGKETIIKVILSDRFAPTKQEQYKILDAISSLPGVEAKIYIGNGFQHRKNFIFKTNNEIRVLVGSINITSAGFFKNLEIATVAVHDDDDIEAKRIVSEFESLWKKSLSIKEYFKVEDMANTTPKFKVGDNVKYIEKIGTINKVIEQTRSYSYKVTIEGQVKTIPEQYLEPYIDIEEVVLDEFLQKKVGTCSDYKIFQKWFRLTRPLENNLYSYLSSKTIFNPHQFVPLLRFLSPYSDKRLFIADEVGVGKTIETGIILNELLARSELDNKSPILVVCPNSLGPKWEKEMKERFRLDFEILNGNNLSYVLNKTRQDHEFPPKYNFSIVSLQLLRKVENLTILKKIDENRESPLFGMVIIDEAHHMRNTGTDSNELGNVLSGMTERMLMLSATPLNLKKEDLFNQLHILNPGVFSDWSTFENLYSPVLILNQIRKLISINNINYKGEIISKLNELNNVSLGEIIFSHPEVKDFNKRLDDSTPFTPEEITKYDRLFVSLNPLYYSFTRTKKREAIEHQVHREVLEVPITLSDKEMRFHNDFIESIKQYHKSIGKDPRTIGFITNTHRRMVSSCIPAMKDYLEWCIKENKIQKVDEYSLEIEDDSEAEFEELDPTLRAEFIRLLKEVETIKEIDSKYDGFKKIVEKIITNPETPQVIVFSFFIRTLEYLKDRLKSDGISVGVIHGKIPVIGDGKKQDRYKIMEAFKKGEYKVLLSSEVGGEGLDFQYCHAIINYDLPYNPMRVEQRIGRIDRFGQQADKIVVGNLFIKNTVDEEIYDRLYRRIRLIEDGIGELEPILGTEISDLQNIIITGRLTEKEKEEMTIRLQKYIESSRQQMDELEKSRNELLSDDYLSEPINKLTKNNFIEPSDAIQLTKMFMNYISECQFKELGKGLGEMVLSDKAVQMLNEFLQKPKNTTGYMELNPLLTPNKSIKVVFDGSIANDNPSYLFLSPTGFWVRFITHYLENEHKICKVFGLRYMSSEIGFPIGKYLVFLFEVRIEGIKREIEFQGVPIDINNLSIVKGIDFEKLPRILGTIKCFEIENTIKEIDIDNLSNVAREYLDDSLKQQREKIEEENTYKIDSIIAALQRSVDSKVKNMKEQIIHHTQKRKSEGLEPDKSYIRLTNAKIETEKSKLESKINELKKKKEMSTDYTLQGIIYLEVGE
ncbi:MAG: SNF2-related protein [Thermoplasmata archaeon]